MTIFLLTMIGAALTDSKVCWVSDVPGLLITTGASLITVGGGALMIWFCGLRLYTTGGCLWMNTLGFGGGAGTVIKNKRNRLLDELIKIEDIPLFVRQFFETSKSR